MHRFKKILFVSSPGTGVDPALRRAVEIASANNGHLTLVQLASLETDALTGDLGHRVESLISDIEEERAEELAELAEAVEEMGVRPETGLLRGKPFLAIVQEVLRNGHDLVVKTAEGPDGGFRARLFGSTDQHLMRKCPAPVWLFKRGGGDGFRSVLAAVDIGQSGNPALTNRILQLASSLAVREGADLHVVHAWTLFRESSLLSPTRGVSREIVTNLMKNEEAERMQRLQIEVGAGVVPGAEPLIQLVKAEPAEGVVKAADSVTADVVVMGTLSRAGVRGLLIGNTAESVLGRLDCSVLTVKPDGFETPVSLDERG